MNNCCKNDNSHVPLFCILFASNLNTNSQWIFLISTCLFFYLKPLLLSMNDSPHNNKHIPNFDTIV